MTFTSFSRTSQPEVVEPVTPVHLSKTLCEVEVADNKVIRFNAEDHLPIISKEEYVQQKQDIITPYRVSHFFFFLSNSTNFPFYYYCFFRQLQYFLLYQKVKKQ